MEVEKYKELKAKALQQINSKVEEIKMLSLKQWALENGYTDIHFSSYEDAKKWVEENVDDNKKRRDFYRTEKAVDEILQAVIKDLELGSSSKSARVVRKVSHKYIIPAATLILSAVVINELAAIGTGKFAEEKIGDMIKKFIEGNFKLPEMLESLSEKIEGLEESKFVKNFDALKKIVEEAKENIDEAANGLNSAIEEKLKNMKDGIVSFTKNLTRIVLGLLEIVGVREGYRYKALKGRKIKYKKEINKKDEEIIKLKQENKKLKSLIGKEEAEETNDIDKNDIKNRRELALKKLDEYKMMEMIVAGLQDFFKDKGIEIPKIPEDCVSMEEYGKYLRANLKKNDVPKEKREEVYAVLDIYKNNIGSILPDLKLGKHGIVRKKLETIKKGINKAMGLTLDVTDGTTYTIRQFVNLALKKGKIKKSDVDSVKNNEIVGEKIKNIEEHNE